MKQSKPPKTVFNGVILLCIALGLGILRAIIGIIVTIIALFFILQDKSSKWFE